MTQGRQEELKETAETAAVMAVKTTGLTNRAILRVILIALGVAVVLWVMHALVSVILLLVSAVFFAYLIAPLVDFVATPRTIGGKSLGLPRTAAIALVYIAIFGALGMASYLLVPRMGRQVSDFAATAPAYLVTARDQATHLQRYYTRYRVPTSARVAMDNGVSQAYDAVGGWLQWKAKGLLVALLYLPWLIIVPILAFFLIKDIKDIRKSALDALPKGRVRWRGRELFDDLNTALAAYIRAQLAACLIVAVLCAGGLAALHVPYALVLGGIAGCLEFIPMLGPALFLVLATVVAVVQTDGQPGWVFLYLGVLRVVEDYVIYPRLVRHGIHLHPLAVILAILCGAELGGVTGVFLAIPVVAVLTVVHHHWLEFRGSPGLVADLLKPVERAAAGAPSVETPSPTPLPVTGTASAR